VTDTATRATRIGQRQLSVCYLFQDEFPWDVRAEKILRSLAANDIQAHVIARNRGRAPRHECLAPNLYAHRLPAIGGSRMTALVNFPAFFSPFWLHASSSAVRSTAANLLLVRDLPLTPTALVVARRHHIPVVMDMAENYPAMMQDTWTFRGATLLDRVIRNPRFLRRLEQAVIPRLDGVIVMSELSRRRVERLGAKPESIWVVSNTPPLERVGEADVSPEASADSPNPGDGGLELLYVGGLEESRGLDVVVRALPAILRVAPAARFHIAGRGSAESSLQVLAESLGVQDSVIFEGWVAPERIPWLIRSADVCLVPHRVTEHIQTTVPNKIFDYMAQSRPVIVTDAVALREIVESAECGEIVPDGDSSAMATAALRLLDPRVRAKIGAAGRRAVFQRYNWSYDENVLLTLVRQMARPQSPGGRSH
jgi:glycosyltransferase involved in cell wall biosynthesis